MTVVLVVGDEPEARALIVEILDTVGYDAAAVDAPTAALPGRAPPDVVVLDSLSRGSAAGLRAAWHGRAEWAAVPVVALSAAARGVGDGLVRAYVARPLRSVELLRAVRRLSGGPDAGRGGER